jgi:hypothetical protein
MKPAPFQMTKEAEAVIRAAITKPMAGMEPALVWTPSSHTWSKEGKFLGAYEGPMVFVGHYKANDRPRDSFFELCGHAVSIMPPTLEQISGRMISCEKVEMHFEGGPHHQYILKVG